MKKATIIIFGLFLCSMGYAQEDAYLITLCDGIKKIRTDNATEKILTQTVKEWSETNKPKITLMDEIKGDSANEYRGKGAHKFKMNQLVVNVYGNQNVGMKSKGDFINSTEADILYSAIEKTVKRGRTVTYSLTEHSGKQEFYFVSFNPKTEYIAKVNGKEATKKGDGIQYIDLGKIKKGDTIVFSISYGQINKAAFESFAIINYNSQQ